MYAMSRLGAAVQASSRVAFAQLSCLPAWPPQRAIPRSRFVSLEVVELSLQRKAQLMIILIHDWCRRASEKLRWDLSLQKAA